MWNLILLLYVFVIIWGLKINFTKKIYIVSKVLNLVVLLMLLFYLASGELLMLTTSIYNFKKIISEEYIGVGVLSAEISLSIFILNLIAASIITVQVIRMIGLKEKGRDRFVKVLPFYLITNLFGSYKYFVRQNELEKFGYYGIGVSLISVLLIILYSSHFIRIIFGNAGKE